MVLGGGFLHTKIPVKNHNQGCTYKNKEITFSFYFLLLASDM